ncbi:MAG: hypothetical protein NVS9B5_35020 [Terriglobales bacterium]
MAHVHKDEDSPPETVKVTLSATVNKIIPPVHPGEAEKAEITVETEEHLYRDLRIENTLEDAEGNPVSLKKGAEVEVTIEAQSDATTPKK